MDKQTLCYINAGLHKQRNFNDFLVTDVAATVVVAADVAVVEDDDGGVGTEHHTDAQELVVAEHHPHHHSGKENTLVQLFIVCKGLENFT